MCSASRLVQELLANYVTDAIVQSPVLLGSMDILGNPTFLVQSLSRGLHDLISMPNNALPQGPRAFVRAMGGGVLSLLQHIAQGKLSFPFESARCIAAHGYSS